MGKMILNGKEYAGSGSEWHEYSTEEKVVGKWIDGKSIYEKTVVLTNPFSVPYNSFGNTSIDSSNINIVISCIGINADGTSYGNLMADPLGTTLKLQTGRNGANANCKTIIIQYTKTTDT